MLTLSFKQSLASLALALFAGSSISYAAGGANGGGGDYTETVINDIRADILGWVSKGGASQLKFPSGVTYETYVAGMVAVLTPHAVIIGSISSTEEQKTNDPDLKVEVKGQPKTCRGSIWKKDGLAHILCNIERFASTPENERYPLVHHEYAGLARLEKNVGASSDYAISNQISGFLETQEVLKLVVKPAQNLSNHNGCISMPGMKCLYHPGLYDGQEFKVLKDFTVSSTSTNYFVNGAQMRLAQAMQQEGKVFCSVAVAIQGMGSKKMIPTALALGNGMVSVPAKINPYSVVDVSWYTEDFVIDGSLNGENLGLSIACGRVQQGNLNLSKATSLNEVLQAFQGVMSESK